MNKHEAKIREIAEEMAADNWDQTRLSDFKSRPRRIKDRETNYFIKVARIAVKHMAEMFKCGYMATLPDDADETIEDRWMKDCRYIMIGRGLIPIEETGKEAGKDGIGNKF